LVEKINYDYFPSSIRLAMSLQDSLMVEKMQTIVKIDSKSYGTQEILIDVFDEFSAFLLCVLIKVENHRNTIKNKKICRTQYVISH